MAEADNIDRGVILDIIRRNPNSVVLLYNFKCRSLYRILWGRAPYFDILKITSDLQTVFKTLATVCRFLANHNRDCIIVFSTWLEISSGNV